MTEQKYYTVEEFFNLNIEEPCELIDGEIIYKYEQELNGIVMCDRPSGRHQLISYRLTTMLMKAYPDCYVLQNVQTRFKKQEEIRESVFSPDIVVARKGIVDLDGGITVDGTPELIVEIDLHHSSLNTHNKTKYIELADAPEIWVMCPETKSLVKGLYSDGMYYTTLHAKGSIMVLNGYEIKLSEVFA